MKVLYFTRIYKNKFDNLFFAVKYN